MAENNKKITTINKEGKTTLATVLLSSIALNIVLFLPNVFGWYSFVVAVLSILFFLLLLNFFRNPKRVFPSEDTDKVVVLSKRPAIIKNTYEIKMENKTIPSENRKNKDFYNYYNAIWKDLDYYER